MEQVRENLEIKTATGFFLVDGVPCVVGEWTYNAGRMGNRSLSCKIRSWECLDSRWVENPYVDFRGERYELKSCPSGEKSNGDARYVHSLDFVSRADSVLNGVFFVDAVDVPTDDDDRPRSGTTSFSFMGTIREFVGRLNASLSYRGISGISFAVDTEVVDEVKPVSFEDQTMMQALETGYETYGVPFYRTVGDGGSVVFTFGDAGSTVTETLKYGYDYSLLKIGKTGSGERGINRCSGYGSDKNLPSYYPNTSPLGELEVVTNRSALEVGITDTEKAALLVGSELKYENIGKAVSNLDAYWEFSGTRKWETSSMWSTKEHSAVYMFGGSDYKLPLGEKVVVPESDERAGAIVNLSPQMYDYNYRAIVNFVVNKPCTVDIVLNCYIESYSGMFGEVTVYRADGTVFSHKTIGPAPHPELRFSEHIKLSEIGAYSVVFTNYPSSPFFAYMDSSSPYFTLESFTFSGDDVYWWKKGTALTELSSWGLAVTGGTPQENDTVTVRVKADKDGGAVTYPRIGKLMPSIFRDSIAKERFYNALTSRAAFDTYYGNYYGESERNGAFSRMYIDADGNPLPFAELYDPQRPSEEITTFDDIFPTIEGMTNADGKPMNAFLDVAYDTDDNDEKDDEGNYLHPYFFVKLPKTDGEHGFNLFAQVLDGKDMTVGLKDGSAAGAQCTIMVAEDHLTNLVQVTDSGNLIRDEKGNVVFGKSGQERQNDTRNNEVWICLQKDENTFGTLVPNKSIHSVKKGDSFVLTGIKMPYSYVIAAERRLERAVIDYMLENNAEKFTFDISFSRDYAAKHPEVMGLIDENAAISIEFDGKTYDMYVSQYTVKTTAASPLPEVVVTITEQATTDVDYMRSAISQVKGDLEKEIGNIDWNAIGMRRFLRKDIKDTADETTTFRRGLQVGDFEKGTPGMGGAMSVDTIGNSTLEVDYLDVRKRASFAEAVAEKLSSVGGKVVVTSASVTFSKVEETTIEQTTTSEDGAEQTETIDVYRCFFNNDTADGAIITNGFVAGDYAMSQSFHNTVSNYWWRKVVSAGADYIDLSKTECDVNSGKPRKGDVAVQLGNETDTARQSALVLSCYGAYAPYFTIYDGIQTFSLENKERAGFETKDGKIHFFVGNSAEESSLDYEDGNMTVTGIVNALKGVISGLLAVRDTDGNIPAGLNGGDDGKDATHGKLLVFAGADTTKTESGEQMSNAATRIYEDGHIVTKSAEIVGRLITDSFSLGSFYFQELLGQNRLVGQMDSGNTSQKVVSTMSVGDRYPYYAYAKLVNRGSYTASNIQSEYSVSCGTDAGESGASYVYNADSTISRYTLGAAHRPHLYIYHRGNKAVTGKGTRVGMEVYCHNVTGEELQNYAILATDGMFAGLRPKIIRITGDNQIPEADESGTGTNKLRTIDHTVVIELTSALTLSLPDKPLRGQHYEIIQTNTQKLTINSTNPMFNLVTGGSTVTSLSLTKRARWTFDWVGDGKDNECWFVSYQTFG